MKWFDIAEYRKDLKAVSIIIGGRGIGKTYSALSFLIEHEIRFIYMRNTKVQIGESATDFGNPFKRLNRDKGWDIHIEAEKEHFNIIDVAASKNIGYAAPLSLFENYRGADISDVDFVLFDEFIENRKLLFDQYKAFVNMRETVGRNRELLGEDPLYCILLSNAQSLNSPILAGYNLIPTIEGMIKSGQQKWKDHDTLVLLPKSEISELKKNTSTYRAIQGTKIYKENIENTFANDSFYAIAKRNLREYKPLCKIDDMYLYMHKSSGKKYVCQSQAVNIPEFDSKDNGLMFYSAYGRYLPMEYARGNVEFSDYTTKVNFLALIE